MSLTREAGPRDALVGHAGGRRGRPRHWLLRSLLILLAGEDLSARPSVAAEQATSLFTELCAVCHGAGGKGDGPSAAGLNPKPADFTDCKVMRDQSEETLFRIIKQGSQSVGRSSVMPAWGEALSDGQIRDLLAVIRGLCTH